MEPFVGASADALAILFSWPGILIPVAGTLLAMTTSFLPGIGTSSMMALIVVFTIGWDPVSVMLLFGALTGGATFMGSITAILFNIPGSAPSAAALLDGYPLARKGYPRTAIACAATASAVGSIVGVVVLLSILPFIRPLLLAFGPFEFFLLGVWGLATLVAIPNNSPLKAAGMAILGFMFAMIGSDPTSGAPRWIFGNLEIYSGISLVLALLGMFTFAEMVDWVKRYEFDRASLFKHAADDSTLAGVTAVFRHYALTIRSAIIGTIIGIIPGVGGTVASFVAYGQAAQANKDEDTAFGEGNIRGLIAPEASVDAKDGGSLLPVVAFGLPGSEAGVMLVAVMAIHGIVPGIPMLTDQLPLTFVLVFSLLLSNLLTSVVGVGISPLLARLTSFPVDRVVLPLLILGMLTIIHLNSQVTDLFLVAGFGIAGYFFKQNDWPRVPFIIAFVLGEFLESNFTLSLRLIELGRVVPYERPASLAILALLGLTLWWLLGKPKKGAKPIVSGDDFWIATALAVFSGILLMTALTGGDEYSVFSIATSLACTLAMATIAFTAWRMTGSRWLPCLPAGRRLPIIAMAALPVLTVLFGLPVAIAATVFMWLAVVSGMTTASLLRALAWGAATGAAAWYFIAQIAHMILPQGLVWSAFG
jgi:putative tricarboxylic transport membrane protein